MTVTASATRTGDFTRVHKCGSCSRAFWTRATWNGVTVKCPHCKHLN